MRILYLTYDGLSDPLGQSQVLPYLEGLVDKGYDILVISFEKDKTQSWKPEARSRPPSLKLRRARKSEGEVHSSSIILHSSAQGNELMWLPLRYHKYPPIFSTLFDIWQLRKLTKRMVKENQIEIVHCRSYITSMVGLWLKRKYGIKFIFDMRGFWADERVEGGLWNLKNPVYKWIYRFFKRKEQEFLAEASAVVSLTDNGMKEILNQITKDKRQISNTYQKSNLNISVIPTCVDTGLFDPGKIDAMKQEEIRSSLGIEKDDFVLLYLGSLGTWYLLDEMMEFFGELMKSRKNSKFLFLTKDQEIVRSWLLGVRRGMDDHEWNELSNSIIVSHVAREIVPHHISICDASVFFIKPTYSKKASSATKMGEVLAMGKPVITNMGWGDVEEIVENGKDGLLVDEFNETAYQKSIDQLESVLQTPAEVIRKKAIKILSLEEGVKKYHEIYETLKSETLKL